MEIYQLPQHASRSITPQGNQILQKMWKHRDLPPLIETFARCLIRRALATGERAARYSTHIDKHCSTCGKIEIDAHLFFHCDFAHAVWFSSDPPLRSDSLPNEDDGVQIILATFITPSDYLLQKN